mmetsp:Transcript_39303/g.92947  ORF Transcript_39303/g.92947 Transcript_39303/m.92947 type:complete len:352 (+) Transcript_39303:596-1651(+)
MGLVAHDPIRLCLAEREDRAGGCRATDRRSAGGWSCGGGAGGADGGESARLVREAARHAQRHGPRGPGAQTHGRRPGTDSAGRADRRAHEYDSRQRRGALCAKPLHLRGSRHPVEAWRGQGAHGPATAGGEEGLLPPAAPEPRAPAPQSAAGDQQEAARHRGARQGRVRDKAAAAADQEGREHESAAPRAEDGARGAQAEQGRAGCNALAPAQAADQGRRHHPGALSPPLPRRVRLRPIRAADDVGGRALAERGGKLQALERSAGAPSLHYPSPSFATPLLSSLPSPLAAPFPPSLPNNPPPSLAAPLPPSQLSLLPPLQLPSLPLWVCTVLSATDRASLLQPVLLRCPLF